MRLVKIILVFVAIYFIRRFIQMYRMMKRIQEQQMEQAKYQQQQYKRSENTGAINADFKVID